MIPDPENNRRRRFIKGSAACLAGMFLPGSPRADSNGAPLKLGYLPITDATPLLIAHALGYFAQEGVEVDKPVMVRSWKVLVESFLTGKFDLTHMLFPIPVWMRFRQNIGIKVLAWNHTNGSAVTVNGNSDIRGFADFGGRRIAVPSWYSMHNLILQMGIRNSGLKPVINPHSATVGPDEVNLFLLSPPEMPTALLGKKIDGFIVAEPFNALCKARFKARIMRFTGDMWKNHPCCVVVCSERLTERRSDAVQRAVNAIVRAQMWCGRNMAETAYLLSREGKGYLPVRQHILKRVFGDLPEKELKHPGWDVSRIGFQPYPYPSATRFIVEQMQKTVVEGNKAFLDGLDAAAAADELVNDAFVMKAGEKTGLFDQPGFREKDGAFTREEVVDVN